MGAAALTGQAAHLLGRLVAPMTMTCARDFRPSISVSSCDTMRRSTSPCARADASAGAMSHADLAGGCHKLSIGLRLRELK